jgi:hypothetical protein
MTPLVKPHACSTVPVDPPAVFTGEGASYGDGAPG